MFFKQLVLISTILGASLVNGLQCNGCRGCGKRQLDKEGPVDVYARWWYEKGFPSVEHLSALKRDQDLQIVSEEHGGQYFDKPKEALGVIILSGEDHAAVAGWDGQNTDSPWQVYGEQKPNTAKFHHLGDSKTVFIGLI